LTDKGGPDAKTGQKADPISGAKAKAVDRQSEQAAKGKRQLVLS
jgi:hypothetical protein